MTTALDAAQATVLGRATLPVLVPDRAPFAAAALATAEADWYALSATWEGITVVVMGDRVAAVDPAMIPAGWVTPTWSQPLVGRNEGIVEATFVAFGASYVVSVECADPLADPRCTQDEAVLDWLGALRRWPAAGGQP